MDKETLDNIFIPFHTKKRTGTGLGMSIAKKIIDAHKGFPQEKGRQHCGQIRTESQSS